MRNLDILIVGVGGQGTLLASNILGQAAMAAGRDVKVSEVHGMSQRGGSVVTHVRIGDEVHAPIIDEGGADVILAFELLEAARWLPWLKKGGKLFVNTQKILPMPVITGAETYPADVQERLTAVADARFIDALTLAEQAGSARAVNTVLLGVLAGALGEAAEPWLDAVRKTVKPKFVGVNEQAFAYGYEEGKR